MLCKTKAIIIKTTKYTDSSLIVKAYTEEYGLQSYITNYSRSKKSKGKASLFQPLSLVDLVIKQSKKGGLERISDIGIFHPYTTLPYDIIKSSIALFLNEVLHRSLQEEHNDMELFEFIKSSLLILDLNDTSNGNFHLFFILQLSRFLGFFPQGKYCNNQTIFDLQEGKFSQFEPLHTKYLDTKLSFLLSQLLKQKYDTLHTVTMSKVQRKEILNSLIVFYQLHIVSFKEIKSQAILQEVIE